jgi:hypothetical protein
MAVSNKQWHGVNSSWHRRGASARASAGGIGGINGGGGITAVAAA